MNGDMSYPGHIEGECQLSLVESGEVGVAIMHDVGACVKSYSELSFYRLYLL